MSVQMGSGNIIQETEFLEGTLFPYMAIVFENSSCRVWCGPTPHQEASWKTILTDDAKVM